MWVVKRQDGELTYYTGRDRTPWSAHLRDACVYDDRKDAEDAVGDMDWPTGSIEFEELPDPGRRSQKSSPWAEQ